MASIKQVVYIASFLRNPEEAKIIQELTIHHS